MWGKTALLGALTLLACQAQADYQCSVSPQDDVVISPQSVQIVGANGKLLISPQGAVQRNGEPLRIDAAARQKAIDYQASLRRDLSWIDNGVRAHLEKGRLALDKVIVNQLGANSDVRSRLTSLDGQLRQQFNRIIEHRNDGLIFHHQAIEQVRQDGERLVQSAMGGILQDSLNEMGTRQASNGENPLQAILGNLGSLQQVIQQEWGNQAQDFQNFGHQVCERVTLLEKQRKGLIAALN